jgi:hypothetical protein
MTLEWIPLSFLVVLPAIYYLYVPLKGWWNYSYDLNPKVIPFDPANTEMPQDVRIHFAELHEDLLKLGFRYLQTVSILENSWHVVTVSYAHESQLCTANLRALHLIRLGKTQRGQCSLTFNTHVNQDIVLSTGNINVLVLSLPYWEFYQLPEEQATERLYAIHQAILRRKGIVPNQRERFAEFVENPTEATRKALVKAYQLAAREGKFIPTADGKRLIMSLWYAYYHAWLHLLPMNLIRMRRVRTRARKLVAELEAGGWLEPPCVSLPPPSS